MSQLSLNQQLWEAACRNDVAIVEAALAAGADPNFRDSPSDPTIESACFSTHSILHEASFRGYDEVVSLLLRHGAEQACDGLYRLSPLHLACLGGHAETAKSLIKWGAKINLRDGNGDSPLTCALMGENPYATPPYWLSDKMASSQNVIDLVEILLAAGADVNHPNIGGETPLWNAVRYQEPEVLEHLISKGAHVHHLNAFNGDLVSEAADTLERAEICVDIPQRRKEGLAMRRRILECMEVLHGHGLGWREIDAKDLYTHYHSEKLYNQIKLLWNSMGSNRNTSVGRSVNP